MRDVHVRAGKWARDTRRPARAGSPCSCRSPCGRRCRSKSLCVFAARVRPPKGAPWRRGGARAPWAPATVSESLARPGAPGARRGGGSAVAGSHRSAPAAGWRVSRPLFSRAGFFPRPPRPGCSAARAGAPSSTWSPRPDITTLRCTILDHQLTPALHYSETCRITHFFFRNVDVILDDYCVGKYCSSHLFSIFTINSSEIKIKKKPIIFAFSTLWNN